MTSAHHKIVADSAKRGRCLSVPEPTQGPHTSAAPEDRFSRITRVTILLRPLPRPSVGAFDGLPRTGESLPPCPIRAAHALYSDCDVQLLL